MSRDYSPKAEYNFTVTATKKFVLYRRRYDYIQVAMIFTDGTQANGCKVELEYEDEDGDLVVVDGSPFFADGGSTSSAGKGTQFYNLQAKMPRLRVKYTIGTDGTSCLVKVRTYTLGEADSIRPGAYQSLTDTAGDLMLEP